MLFSIAIIAIIIFLYALAACNYNRKSKKDNVPANTINLHLGDHHFVEVTKNADHKVNLKLVDTVKDSSITLKVSFTYELIQGNVGYHSVLQIKNPFSKTISFKESVKRTEKATYDETGFVKLEPKVNSCTLWSFKIENIILTDFKIE